MNTNRNKTIDRIKRNNEQDRILTDRQKTNYNNKNLIATMILKDVLTQHFKFLKRKSSFYSLWVLRQNVL